MKTTVKRNLSIELGGQIHEDIEGLSALMALVNSQLGDMALTPCAEIELQITVAPEYLRHSPASNTRVVTWSAKINQREA